MSSPPDQPPVCSNCLSAVPPESSFCNKCGHKITDEAVASLDNRLTKLEQRITAYSHKAAAKQDYLEIDTAAKVVERVKKWTTTFLYFAAFPLGILVLALAVVFGKGVFDLRKVASSSKASVEVTLEQARGVAQEAKNTADDSLAKSKRMSTEVNETQAAVSKLKDQVNVRLTEVENLRGRVKGSETQVEALRNSVDTQTKALHFLADEVTAVKNAKSTSEVINRYPILGGHMAGGGSGWIDPKQKVPGKTYALLSLVITQHPTFKADVVAEAKTALENNAYSVFLDFVSVYAGSPTTSNQPVGTPLNADSCTYWVHPPSQAPCILYFSPGLKDSAMRARELVKAVQVIPDARIQYIDPKTLNADQRELLTLSHMDVAIVLAQQ